MNLSAAWNRVGERVVPWSERTVQSLAVISLYLSGIFALILVPLELLTALAKHAGSYDGKILSLTPLGGWLLIGLVGLTFLWSIIVGGFAKALFTRKHLGWFWLLLFGLGLLIGLTMFFDQMDSAMRAFFAEPRGDNPKVAGFIAFWALMIGYASKAVWDEARDRVSQRVASFLPKDEVGK